MIRCIYKYHNIYQSIDACFVFFLNKKFFHFVYFKNIIKNNLKTNIKYGYAVRLISIKIQSIQLKKKLSHSTYKHSIFYINFVNFCSFNNLFKLIHIKKNTIYNQVDVNLDHFQLKSIYLFSKNCTPNLNNNYYMYSEFNFFISKKIHNLMLYFFRNKNQLHYQYITIFLFLLVYLDNSLLIFQFYSKKILNKHKYNYIFCKKKIIVFFFIYFNMILYYSYKNKFRKNSTSNCVLFNITQIFIHNMYFSNNLSLDYIFFIFIVYIIIKKIKQDHVFIFFPIQFKHDNRVICKCLIPLETSFLKRSLFCKLKKIVCEFKQNFLFKLTYNLFKSHFRKFFNLLKKRLYIIFNILIGFIFVLYKINIKTLNDRNEFYFLFLIPRNRIKMILSEKIYHGIVFYFLKNKKIIYDCVKHIFYVVILNFFVFKNNIFNLIWYNFSFFNRNTISIWYIFWKKINILQKKINYIKQYTGNEILNVIYSLFFFCLICFFFTKKKHISSYLILRFYFLGIFNLYILSTFSSFFLNYILIKKKKKKNTKIKDILHLNINTSSYIKQNILKKNILFKIYKINKLFGISDLYDVFEHHKCLKTSKSLNKMNITLNKYQNFDMMGGVLNSVQIKYI